MRLLIILISCFISTIVFAQNVKTPSTPLEILTATRNYLTTETWTKGESNWPNKATLQIAINNNAKGRGVDTNRSLAEYAIINAIGKKKAMSDIKSFNDDPSTTLNDILDIIDDAISKIK